MVRASLPDEARGKSNSTFKLTLAHRTKKTRTELKLELGLKLKSNSNRYPTTLIGPHRLSPTREHHTCQKRTRNQKEKYGTFPLLIIPVYVFQTAFSLINWGKWLRTSSPGPVPYCPFPFSFPHPPLFPVPTVLDSPYSPTCSLSTMFYVVNSRTLDSTLPPRYCYC